MLGYSPHKDRDVSSELDVRYILASSKSFVRDQKPSPSSDTPREVPTRARPTESWTYRWLGVGVAGGLAAGIGFGVGVATLSTILISATASTPATIFAFGLASIEGSLPLIFLLSAGSTLARKKDSFDIQTEQRMARIVDSLCLRAGKEIHQVIPLPNLKEVMGMVDGPRNRNILIYNSRIGSCLNDRQLEALVAHEISHADRASNGWQLTLKGLSGFAKTTTLLGSYWYALSAGIGIPFACAFALGNAMVTGTVLSTCLNIASRAEEMRTDIRAVQLTKDLGSLVEALEIIHGYPRFADLPKFLQILLSLSTHPNPVMRERWLRGACGNPQPTSR